MKTLQSKPPLQVKLFLEQKVTVNFRPVEGKVNALASRRFWCGQGTGAVAAHLDTAEVVEGKHLNMMAPQPKVPLPTITAVISMTL